METLSQCVALRCRSVKVISALKTTTTTVEDNSVCFLFGVCVCVCVRLMACARVRFSIQLHAALHCTARSFVLSAYRFLFVWLFSLGGRRKLVAEYAEIASVRSALNVLLCSSAALSEIFDFFETPTISH